MEARTELWLYDTWGTGGSRRQVQARCGSVWGSWVMGGLEASRVAVFARCIVRLAIFVAIQHSDRRLRVPPLAVWCAGHGIVRASALRDAQGEAVVPRHQDPQEDRRHPATTGETTPASHKGRGWPEKVKRHGHGGREGGIVWPIVVT